MDIEIVFTAHVRMKFDVLRRHGVELTPAQVRETILSPELVVRDDLGNPIAQRALDDLPVLRVVYRIEGERRIVITLYPGRRERYDNKL